MIYLLHDVHSYQDLGGGALICEAMDSLKDAPDKITILNAAEFKRELVDGCPIIMARAETFNGEDLRWIADTQVFIKEWFDYDFCSTQTGVGHDCSLVCSNRFPAYQYIIDKAKLNIYQSPGQRDIHKKYLNVHNDMVWPGPIEIELFLSDGTEVREDRHVALGPELEHKGYPYLRKLFPDLVVMRGMSREKMADYLKHSKYYVHLPIWYEPLNRGTVEAYLAGCELVVNKKRIGFFSFPFNFEDKNSVVKELEDINANFWNKVGPVLGY